MKIVAYCRVSTDKGDQLDSLDNQKRFFAEYAQKHNHKLVRVYADEGISGTRLKKRTEFLRLLADAKLGLFEAVVVKDISRFARNTVDFLQSIRELKSLGINTLFITANMESLGESEFVLTIFGAMAQEESANLSKRVKFGKRINAEKGRVPQRIFGYDRIDNYTLCINETEAEIVREIYRLYTEEGMGCRTISLYLNAENKKTKFNCDWNPRAVRRVLTNPIYSGHYVNHKYEIKDYLTGKQVHIPKEEHFHHNRPEWAIISSELFSEAQKQLNERRAQYDSGPPFRDARYSTKHLFSTLIKCEHCGRSFCRKHYKYKTERIYWKCTTNDQFTAVRCDNNIKLEEQDLIDQVRDYLSNIIQNRDAFVSDIISAVCDKTSIENSPQDVDKLKKKQQSLLTKKERYQELYANDIITMDELKSKVAQISKDLRTLEEELDDYNVTQSAKKKIENLSDSYIQEIEDFLSLKTVTNMDLRKIIECIIVDKFGNVRIILKNLSIS